MSPASKVIVLENKEPAVFESIKPLFLSLNDFDCMSELSSVSSETEWIAVEFAEEEVGATDIVGNKINRVFIPDRVKGRFIYYLKNFKKMI